MPRITPNLWFDTQGLEAAELYVSVVPGSKITHVSRDGDTGRREPGTQAAALVTDADPARADRAVAAMLSTVEIDIAAMQAAADGTA